MFVRLRKLGEDEFYILTWSDLQKVAIAGHRRYLETHGGVRPRRHDSFHVAILPTMLKDHRDRWEVLDDRLLHVV